MIVVLCSPAGKGYDTQEEVDLKYEMLLREKCLLYTAQVLNRSKLGRTAT